MLKFKYQTYCVVWMKDLEDFICKELGVVRRGEIDPATGERDYDGFQINLDAGFESKGQDSYIILDLDEEYGGDEPLEWWIENYGEKSFDYYMKQLYDKGLLPTDYPLFIQFYW